MWRLIRESEVIATTRLIQSTNKTPSSNTAPGTIHPHVSAGVAALWSASVCAGMSADIRATPGLGSYLLLSGSRVSDRALAFASGLACPPPRSLPRPQVVSAGDDAILTMESSKARLTTLLEDSGEQRMLSLGGDINDVKHTKLGQQKRGLPIGKLSADHLRSLLSHPPKHDPRLLIGPQVGEDAAVIDLGDRYLVVTTDPITFATDHIGRYAVHVNANDVAVLGARPLWFFVVMLLPESHTTPELAETIMADVRTTCDELGITLGGGHTEITQGLDRPILVGQMLGEVAPTSIVRKTRIAIGDQILLTRSVAIEGTAILAREKSELLRKRVEAHLLARAARFLIDPGISVVSAALAAANVGEAVHAMHDPTEGGLATGLFELVEPPGLGARIVREHIPVSPETEAICVALALDPLKLLASGALLIVVAPAGVDSVLTSVAATGVTVVVIGEVRPGSEGIVIVTKNAIEPLIPPARDEIARAFESGSNPSRE